MKPTLKYLVLIFLLLFIADHAKGQDTGTEAYLRSLFESIINSGNDEEKIRLNDTVSLIIDSYVRSDSVLSHKFPTVRNLGQISSDDSKVKIVTWNLMLRNGTNRYFLYIIFRDKKKTNHIYSLNGENKQSPPDTLAIYNSGNWYGALYYAIQPVRSNRKTFYTILGFDFGSSTMSRKIIDFISFENLNEPLFGADLLMRNGQLKKREVIQYSPEGIVSLRFDSPSRIVFDHISPFATGHEGSPDRLGAGLFFDSYRLRKGIWNFEPNIDIRNSK